MARKSSKVAEVTKKQKGVKVADVSDKGLALCASLARIQLQREQDVAAAEDALATAKEALQQVKEVDLPEAMREVGLKTFTTEDGAVVTIHPEVQVAISVANRPAAYQWLIDNGFGGLLKLNVSLHFDRGDREKAEKLAAQLIKKGIEVDVEQSVHAQTLKAFAKERMADTESELEFPLDLFGARPYTVAKIKKAKE
jgi:hypothetical protein